MKTSPSKVNWRGQTRRKASESKAPEARKSHLLKRGGREEQCKLILVNSEKVRAV